MAAVLARLRAEGLRRGRAGGAVIVEVGAGTTV